MEDEKNSRRLKRNVDRARMTAAQKNEKIKKDKANQKIKKDKANEKIKKDKANEKRKKDKAKAKNKKDKANEENKNKKKGKYRRTVMMKSNTEGLSSSVSDSSRSYSGSGEINVYFYYESHLSSF